jgi:hypothetical protein
MSDLFAPWARPSLLLPLGAERRGRVITACSAGEPQELCYAHHLAAIEAQKQRGML